LESIREELAKHLFGPTAQDCTTALDTSLALDRPKRTVRLRGINAFSGWVAGKEILQHGSSQTGVGEHAHDFCCWALKYEIKCLWVMGFALSGENAEKSA
jgi:hypothetical protein